MSDRGAMSTGGYRGPDLTALPRGAAVVFGVFAVALLALGLTTALWSFDGSAIYRLDFDVYRQGAAALAGGHPLYDHPLVLPGASVSMPFTYPPLAAIVFVPTTWISYGSAALLWTLLSGAALLGCLYVVARSLGWDPRLSVFATVVMGAGAVWLIPVRTNLGMGQVNLLLMVLVAADVLVKRPWWPRGLLIGVAAAVKLTPAGFVLFFLLRRDYRSAAVAAATGLALTGVAALVSPQNSRAFWLDLGDLSGRVQVFQGVANLSLRGLIDRLPLPAAVGVALWVGSAAAVVVVGAIAIRRQLREEQPGVALAVNAIVILLVSPVSWDHHWVWVAPFLLLCAPAVGRGSPAVFLVMAGTAVVFLVVQVTYQPVRGGWLFWLAWAVGVVVWLTRRTLVAGRRRGGEVTSVSPP